METLQSILREQGNEVTSVDLEYKQIDDLTQLLPLLAQFSNLEDLNLHGNRLKFLPEELAMLESLVSLDISNNMFEDLTQVIEVLANLPNLKHLNIQVQSKEEELFIIDQLPSLETLNQTQKQPTQAEQGNEITLQQEDLEHMAILYDNIRELFREQDPSSDSDMQSQFDSHVRNVMKDLQTQLSQVQPDHIVNTNILQAKFNLYEICFKQVIRFFGLNDKRVESVMQTLHDEHFQIFRDLSNLTMAIKQSDSQQFDQQKQMPVRSAGQSEENFRLKEELAELQDQMKELEQENKKYLDMIIRHSKGENIKNIPQKQTQVSLDFTGTKSSPSKKHPPPPKQFQHMQAIVQPQNIRNLTLKQLKDIINEIYESKQKYDQKYFEAKLPRETMEQHMYTYLNQKYGLKNLIIEWATSIISALKKYGQEDNDVSVFGKILRNECDEEFRFVQTQVKNTIRELLKMYLVGKYPFKHQAEIKEMINQRVNGQILEEEATDIIKYMYNQEDQELLLSKLRGYYIAQPKVSQQDLYLNLSQFIDFRKRMTREEQILMMNEKEKYKIEYAAFQKIILDFQLKSHEKYLKSFILSFKGVDQDQNGIIDENEFRQLIEQIGLNLAELDIQRFLNAVDPYSHQSITFSQCITLFSSETVNTPEGQISILQQLSNL